MITPIRGRNEGIYSTIIPALVEFTDDNPDKGTEH